MSDSNSSFPINGTRSEMEDWINQQVAKDPDLRQQLLQNPHQTLSRLVGRPVPEQFKIVVAEETETQRIHVARSAGYEHGVPGPSPALPGTELHILEEQGNTYYLILRHPAHDNTR